MRILTAMIYTFGMFKVPEIPNAKKAKILAKTREKVAKGEYYSFTTNQEALAFLHQKLLGTHSQLYG